MNKDDLRLAIAKLRDAHKYGKKIAAELKTGGGTQYGKFGYENAAKTVGDEHGVTITGATARHMVTFADRYTEDQFGMLIAECRQHQHCLGFDLVVRLLPIKPVRLRTRLQKRAIAGKWSKIRLGQEMRLLNATKSYAAGREEETGLYAKARGRNPKAVDDVESLLGELQDDAIKWRRICRILDKQNDRSDVKKSKASTGADISKDLRDDINALVEKLEVFLDYDLE